MAPLSPQPSHLALITPICTASATVGLALYQFPVFYSFLRADPPISGKPLSRYWDPNIRTGVPIIMSLNAASIVTGVLCARWLNTHQTLETTDVGRWYTYGSVFAFGHFLFWPLVAGPIRRMIEQGKSASTLSEEDTDAHNRKEMSNWFMWHTIRTALVDLPALWCFAEGAALSFWVANV